jgi:Tol biopolymer transport system component
MRILHPSSLWPFLCFLLAASTGPRAALAQAPATGLVDVTDSGASCSAGVFSALVSANGQYVVFTTTSTDLTPLHANGGLGVTYVFVRDLATGRTTPVSVNRDGTGISPAGDASITPDGRYVAFASSATDLVGPDPGGPGFTNVYLRDMLLGETILVSQTPSGQRGNNASGGSNLTPDFSISDDGRYVSFVSMADDLVPNDTNHQRDVFVRDVKEGRTILVSTNQAGTASGNHDSSYAVMTPDGRFVAFRSSSSDLVPNDINGFRYDIFLRDLQTGTTKLVTANRLDGGSANADADARTQGDLAVSADGRYVAFTSSATDLVAGDGNGLPGSDEGQDVFVRDTVAGATKLVSVNKDGTGSGAGPSGALSMTPDGRFVSFVSAADDLVPNDTNKVQDVFLRDLQTGTTSLVTVNLAGIAAGIQDLTCEGNPAPDFLFISSRHPDLSADGRYVTFASSAGGLTAVADQNCFASPSVIQDGYDIFVRDTVAGSTRLVSVNYDGTSAGDHRSYSPHISSDGASVLFLSNADNLSANDANGQTSDAFVNVNIPRSGQVQFTRPVFAVDEGGGKATVSVSRSGDAAGSLTVGYTTLGGTATSGSEFTPTSGTLTFAPGETVKQFDVPVFDDTIDEDDETIYLRLTDATGTVQFGEPSVAAVLIRDDDPSPLLSISDASVGEGDSGAPDMTFLVSLSVPSARTVTVNFATQAGSATPGISTTPGADFNQSAGTLTFPPGVTAGLLKIRVFPDTLPEPDETFSVILSNPQNAQIARGTGVGTILDDDGPIFTKLQLTAGAFTVSETAGRIDLQVTRTGDLSSACAVSYATLPNFGTASDRSDYTAAAGMIHFAPNETSKIVTVFITNDAFRENDEAFFFEIYAPQGCTLGATSFATITIQSDDTADGPSPVGTAFDTAFYVRQQYIDFLGREPDPSGLQFWTNEITSCGADAQCAAVKRVNVSAAFFLSIEFQETGYLVYRTYKAAFGNLPGKPVPVPLFNFLANAQQIGDGVVVNQGDWQARLEQNKRDYFDAFVRDEYFSLIYPQSLSPEQFVGALNANAGSVLSAAERDALAGDLRTGAKTRAQVLRAVAENPELTKREFNKAFVLMQYFGYLRRDPDAAPDFNFNGYNFWLSKLEQFNGNFVQAEMVKAFITSTEYRQRFGTP